MFEHGYDKWQAYGQAKTANALFAVQLDALGQEAGVRAFSLHPGGILTALAAAPPQGGDGRTLGWIDEDGHVRSTRRFKTPEQGAATLGLGGDVARSSRGWAESSARTATSPRRRPTDGTRCFGVRAWATDPEQAARLWALSAD